MLNVRTSKKCTINNVNSPDMHNLYYPTSKSSLNKYRGNLGKSFFGGKTTSKIRNDELSKNENIHNMLTEVIV